jgi:hypothetical protein
MAMWDIFDNFAVNVLGELNRALAIRSERGSQKARHPMQSEVKVLVRPQ